MMPWEPARDMMRRTMANLEFIERHARDRGPYEVTQLVNSFLGALAHPWEEFRSELLSMPLAVGEGWPSLSGERTTDEQPQSLGDALRLLRNGIAHGNLTYCPGPHGEILAISVCNRNRGKRTWGVTLTVSEMRSLLTKFAEVAEDLAARDIAQRRERARPSQQPVARRR